jgi:hypothetical protein
LSRIRAAFSLFTFLSLEACRGASSDPGTGALMLVEGAQFVPGSMPRGDAGGPKVVSLETLLARIIPGVLGTGLRGTMEESASGAAIALRGDAGYWVVPAGAPSFETPGLYSIGVTLDFAAGVPPGALTVDVSAVGPNVRFGPRSSVGLMAATTSISSPLVFSLVWDTESDLDLHVVDPGGAEIWARNITSAKMPPVGAPPDPGATAMSGTLDFDSNSMCVIDGRREEKVIYRGTPPTGRYLVRVDTFSLCGQPDAHWTVAAARFGVPFARASGTSTDFDTRFSHDRGAGVLALEIDQP